MIKRFEQPMNFKGAPTKADKSNVSLQGLEHLIPKTSRPPMTAQELGVTEKMLAAPRKPFKKATQADFARVGAKASKR